MAEDLASKLSDSAPRITKHMNEDHRESVLAYAHYYAKIADACDAWMTSLNPDGVTLCSNLHLARYMLHYLHSHFASSGFVLSVKKNNGEVKEGILIPYPKPLTSSAAVRKWAVAMHHEAFAGLGFRYRVSKGYYSRALTMVVSHTGGAKVWIPMALGVAASAYFLLRKAKS